MKIKPKYINAEDINFKLSFQSRKILEHYSGYTGLTQSQVLEEMLIHLIKDEDFITYIDGRRSNTHIKRELGLFDGQD